MYCLLLFLDTHTNFPLKDIDLDKKKTKEIHSDNYEKAIMLRPYSLT